MRAAVCPSPYVQLSQFARPTGFTGRGSLLTHVSREEKRRRKNRKMGGREREKGRENVPTTDGPRTTRAKWRRRWSAKMRVSIFPRFQLFDMWRNVILDRFAISQRTYKSPDQPDHGDSWTQSPPGERLSARGPRSFVARLDRTTNSRDAATKRLQRMTVASCRARVSPSM